MTRLRLCKQQVTPRTPPLTSIIFLYAIGFHKDKSINYYFLKLKLKNLATFRLLPVHVLSSNFRIINWLVGKLKHIINFNIQCMLYVFVAS